MKRFLYLLLLAPLFAISLSSASPAKAQSYLWCYFLDFRQTDYGALYDPSVNGGFSGTYEVPGYGIINGNGATLFTFSNQLSVDASAITFNFAAVHGLHDNINITVHAQPFGIHDPGFLSDQVNRNLTIPFDQETVSFTASPSGTGEYSPLFKTYFAANDDVYLTSVMVQGNDFVDPFQGSMINGESPTPCAYETATPTPTASATLSPTATLTPSPTLTPSQTPTGTQSPTPSPTPGTFVSCYDLTTSNADLTVLDGTWTAGLGVVGQFEDGHSVANAAGYITLPDGYSVYSVDLTYSLTAQGGPNALTRILVYNDSPPTTLEGGGGVQYVGGGTGSHITRSWPAVALLSPGHFIGKTVRFDVNSGDDAATNYVESVCVTWTPDTGFTPTATLTPSLTPSQTPSPTVTLFPTQTPSLVPTATRTPIVFPPTWTLPPLATLPGTPTHTYTPGGPTITPTLTPSPTLTPTITPTFSGIIDEPANGLPGGLFDWLIQFVSALLNLLIRIFQQIIAWLGQLASLLSGISVSWNSAAPTPIAGLPHCATDRFASEVCAIYYILTYTLFAPGTLGAAILPVATVAIYGAVVFTIIKGIIATAGLVRGILRG